MKSKVIMAIDSFLFKNKSRGRENSNWLVCLCVCVCVCVCVFWGGCQGIPVSQIFRCNSGLHYGTNTNYTFSKQLYIKKV